VPPGVNITVGKNQTSLPLLRPKIVGVVILPFATSPGLSLSTFLFPRIWEYVRLGLPLKIEERARVVECGKMSSDFQGMHCGRRLWMPP
jgi:hypothetical protein